MCDQFNLTLLLFFDWLKILKRKKEICYFFLFINFIVKKIYSKNIQYSRTR
jgi:hypothetical protein